MSEQPEPDANQGHPVKSVVLLLLAVTAGLLATEALAYDTKFYNNCKKVKCEPMLKSAAGAFGSNPRGRDSTQLAAAYTVCLGLCNMQAAARFPPPKKK